MRYINFLKVYVGLLIFTVMVSCGGSSGGGGNQVADEGAVFSALASVFSGVSGSSDTSSRVRYIFDGDSRGDICDGLWRSPTGILMLSNESEGQYGSSTDSVSLVSTDFCEDQSTRRENSGDGADGQGRFAAFVMLKEVTGDCEDSSGNSVGTATFLSGSGVTRNIVNSDNDVLTEIYGRFQMNDENNVVDCTLRLLDGVLVSDNSSCSDRRGDTVSLASGVTCQMNADLQTVPDITEYKGHYALDRDSEERNATYACDNAYENLMTNSAQIRYIGESACASYIASYGVNIEGLGMGFKVYDPDPDDGVLDWTFEETGGSLSDVASRIKLLHRAGLQVQLSLDFNYQLTADGAGDNNDFPQEMVDSEEYQEDLAELITDYAEAAEHLDVEVFAPISEDERMFAESDNSSGTRLTTGPEYLQSIRSRVEEKYSGKLLYMGFEFVSGDQHDYDFTGYDVLGIDLSPMGGSAAIQTEAEFTAYVNQQMGYLSDLAEAYGNIPFYITNAGIWGTATEVELPMDWTTQDNAALAFEIMFSSSDNNGATGMMPWEGADGEVVFSDYPGVQSLIADEFGGSGSF